LHSVPLSDAAPPSWTKTRLVRKVAFNNTQ
jgi:hypothetical protein